MHGKPLVRIAYVRFTAQGTAYVARCDREDIGVGAEVEVLMQTGTLHQTIKTGIVTAISYERWSCRCIVTNLRSEVTYSFDRQMRLSRHIRPDDVEAAQAVATHHATTDNLCRDELVARLQQLGFKTFEPRTVSWMCALIASNRTQTLYILFGRRSVDFKLYDTVRETHLDDRGRLHTDGGTFVRNWYAESAINIHSLILTIAESFCNDEAIASHHLCDHGISWGEQKRRYKASLPQTAADEMRALYDVMAADDGEPVYLSDGVWLHADGSMHDDH